MAHFPSGFTRAGGARLHHRRGGNCPGSPAPRSAGDAVGATVRGDQCAPGLPSRRGYRRAGPSRRRYLLPTRRKCATAHRDIRRSDPERDLPCQRRTPDYSAGGASVRAQRIALHQQRGRQQGPPPVPLSRGARCQHHRCEPRMRPKVAMRRLGLGDARASAPSAQVAHGFHSDRLRRQPEPPAWSVVKGNSLGGEPQAAQ